jgi:hypothetical protein
VTSCYGGPCPGIAGSATCATTPYCGQDAQYPPRSRTLIARTVGGQSVVDDSRTGLTWMKSVIGPMSAQAAISTCAAQTFAGMTGWRLPGIMELNVLFDLGRNPVINPVFDLPAPSAPPWFFSATTPNVGCNPTDKFFASLNFSTVHPEGGGACSPMWSYSIRCVRGPEWTPDVPNRFATQMRSGQPVVLDALSGLEWQGGMPSPVATWPDALGRCEGLSWGGATDWRLPDYIEMQSVAMKWVELGGAAMGMGMPGDFVTSTPIGAASVAAVRIQDGYIYRLPAAGSLSMFPGLGPPVMRCVRLGR